MIVDTFATVIDTRSGALTYLRPSVGGADGGTIAVGMGATMKSPQQAQAFSASTHYRRLPADACSSPSSARSSD